MCTFSPDISGAWYSEVGISKVYFQGPIKDGQLMGWYHSIDLDIETPLGGRCEYQSFLLGWAMADSKKPGISISWSGRVELDPADGEVQIVTTWVKTTGPDPRSVLAQGTETFSRRNIAEKRFTAASSRK